MNAATLDKATDKLIAELKPEELGRYVAELTDQFGRDMMAGRMTHDAAQRKMNLLFEKRLKYMPANDYIRFLLAQNAATVKILMAVIGEKDLKIMDLKMSLMEASINGVASIERILTAMNFTGISTDEAEADRLACIEEARESMLPFYERLIELRKESEEYAKDEVWAKIGKVLEHTKRESILSPEIVEKYNLPAEAVQ